MGLLKNAILNPPFIPCMPKSMTCYVELRDLKPRQRRLWLMPQDWLMNSELNKTTALSKRRPNVLSPLNSPNLKDSAAKGGRNAMAKLESRIREMEIELGSVQSKTSDA